MKLHVVCCTSGDFPDVVVNLQFESVYHGKLNVVALTSTACQESCYVC